MDFGSLISYANLVFECQIQNALQASITIYGLVQSHVIVVDRCHTAITYEHIF
jgi:hypothetical protein